MEYFGISWNMFGMRWNTEEYHGIFIEYAWNMYGIRRIYIYIWNVPIALSLIQESLLVGWPATFTNISFPKVVFLDSLALYFWDPKLLKTNIQKTTYSIA